MTIVNVFTNDNKEYGNPVGISIDITNKISAHQRQTLASKSGLSEGD